MTNEIWISILHFAALRSPSLIIGIVGLWFSLSRRSLHPRVSAIAAIGFGCLLLGVVAFLVMQASLQIAIAEGRALDQPDIIVRWNLVNYLLSTVSLAAISVAVFIDRKPSTHLD